MTRIIHSFLFYLVLVFVTVVLGLAAIIVALIDRESGVILALERTWARILLHTARVKVAVMGRDRLDLGRPAIYMVNHQSYVDVFCLASFLPVPFRIVAKRELYRIPVFGQVLWAVGHVKVDRENREQAIASLQAAAREICERSISLVVFPEGTRSRTGELGRYKKGGFHLALQAGYPIVPVAIRGSLPIWPKGRWTIRPGHVRITVGSPIGPCAYSAQSVEDLMQEVRSWMEGALREMDKVGVARA